jgi:hypothetical protein
MWRYPTNIVINVSRSIEKEGGRRLKDESGGGCSC